MSKKLNAPEDIELPEEVRIAAIEGKLTFFVGNGVSRLYGTPSWDALANKMLKTLVSNEIINYSKYNLLLKQSTKTKISIADHFYKNDLQSGSPLKLNYKTIIEEEFDLKKNVPIAYMLLAKIGCRFLTTNYDSLFSDALNNKFATKPITTSSISDSTECNETENNQTFDDVHICESMQEFRESDLQNNNLLIHIHGSISNERKLIASSLDYINLYGDKQNIENLKLILKDQTVVFIGYGLEELELLDLIVRSTKDSKSKSKINKFFNLLPLFTHEYEVYELLEIYYKKQLGITLLPYSRDLKDFHGLEDIIENWSSKLISEINPPSNNYKKSLLEQLLNKFKANVDNRSNIVQEIFNLINDNHHTAMSFFSKLIDEKEISIFCYLDNVGAFNIDQLQKLSESKKTEITNHLWAQSKYLEFIAQYIRENNLSKENIIVIKFITIIKSLIKNKDNKLLTSSTFKSFSLLPPNVTSCDDVEYFFKSISCDNDRNFIIIDSIHKGFDHLINIVSEKEHDRKLFKCWLKNVFSTKKGNNIFGSDEDLSFFDEYNINEFEKKHFELEKLLNDNKVFLILDALNVFKDLLNKKLKLKNVDKTSNYWRPAIEIHNQNKFHTSANSIYVEKIFKYLDFLSKNRIDVKNHVNKLKNSSYTTHNRIYIALVNENPEVYSVNKCAMKLIDYKLDKEIKHEAFNFLSNHFSKINDQTKEMILDLIDNMEDEYASNPNDKKLFSAWAKIPWLQAIKNSDYSRVNELFNKYYKITGNTVKHPDFNSYSSHGWVGPSSPWTKDDFAKSSPKLILDKLKNFIGTEDIIGDSKEGLSRVLEEYVSEDPIKISNILDKINDLEPIYISAIYDGYTKAWKEKKYVPTEDLLNAFIKLLNNGNFKERLKQQESKFLWTATSISRFISQGVKHDDNAFDPKLNCLCYNIISSLLTIIEPLDDSISNSDAFTKAINEPRGVIFETAILWTLRVCRISSDDDKTKNWNKLKVLLEPALKNNSLKEISLRALIGAYYRQILYLNKSWLYENIDLIAPKGDNYTDLRIAFMEGFAYVSTFVEDIYLLLRGQGLLLEFLRHDPDEMQRHNRFNRLQGRMAELSLIAYILDIEDLNSGIIGEILSQKEPTEWKKLISSIVPIFSGDTSDVHKERIMNLVIYIINEFESNYDFFNLNNHFQGISSLLKIFDDLDNECIKSIIKISAKNSNGFWDLLDIIEFLHKQRNKNPGKIGELFLLALNETNGVPTYPDDKIHDIFDSIKSSNNSIILSKICYIYNERYPEFELLEKFCNN